MTIARLATTTAIVVVFSGVVSAHPGHGRDRDGTSLMHYATSPMHVLTILGTAAILFLGKVILDHRRRLAESKSLAEHTLREYRSQD